MTKTSSAPYCFLLMSTEMQLRAPLEKIESNIITPKKKNPHVA